MENFSKKAGLGMEAREKKGSFGWLNHKRLCSLVALIKRRVSSL